MSAKFIVCNGIDRYERSNWTEANDPVHEYTLMTEHITCFGKLEHHKFHTWLISREMSKKNVREVWLEETPEQIRSMMRTTIFDILRLIWRPKNRSRE